MGMVNMSKIERFYALDSFRGICALSVAVHHMHIVDSVAEIEFFRNANFLVEFFFVLSGFVLAHTYAAKEGFDIKRFCISRTFRLLPLHWLMLAVIVFLECGKLLAYKKGLVLNNVPFTGDYSPSELIPNFFLVQSWTDSTSPVSFNYPSWSISVEYYMYMIFASVLFFFSKVRYAVWGLIAVIAFSILYTGSELLTIPVARGLSCFFSGALSYVLFSRVRGLAKLGLFWMTALEISSLVAVVVVITCGMENKSLLASFSFCVVVIIFAFDSGAVSKLFKMDLFSFAGKISYSIYLTHAAVLLCFVSVFMVAQKILGLNLTPMVNGQRYIDTGNYLVNNFIVILALLLVVCVSSFTYKYIEVKGQEAGKRLINRISARDKLPLLKD